MASRDGKKFEANIKQSCDKEGVFFDRIKDISISPNIPEKYRKMIPRPKNKYDCYIFSNHYLFPIELKSTQETRMSFSESIIKKHQIDSLTWANQFASDGIIAGFLFNFRTQNETYFIHIQDFNTYKEIAESGSKEHSYPKVNKSSMPIEVCRQIGIEIKYKKLRTNYHYYIKEFIERAIEKYK